MKDMIVSALPPAERERAGYLLADLELMAEAPDTLLDMGTGTGCMAALVADRFPGIRGVLVDSHRDLRHLPESDRFEFVEWPFGSRLDGQTFDLVMSTDVLEHVPNWKNATRELASFVAPGGYLYIQTPSNYASPNYPSWLVATNRALGLIGRNLHRYHVRHGLSCKSILDCVGPGFQPIVASESYVLNGEVPCSFKPRTHLLLQKRVTP